MKKQPRKSFLGAGRVAFLARKENIQKMIEQGYPLIFIYEKYSDELSISYSQFVRYVQKYFRREQHGSEGIHEIAAPGDTKPTVSKPVSSEARNDEPHDEQEESNPRKKFEKDAEDGDFF